MPTMAMAKAIQLIKSGSSAWIHQTFRALRNFAWQQGYGAFRVSVSQLPEAISYIDHQVEPTDQPSLRVHFSLISRHFVPG
ncbi:MAG: transposase [Verrucomicrobia bacterium]|nr:transposase [Verrucomicrobiota bacterium]